ncbi:hypothetical protein C8R43DRAFT_1123005 [Mycena crocata]|nr:hypothetical protein C8R43DRAFT_1123005 [Mycena crocata]
MSRNSVSPQPAEVLSAGGTEFYSAPGTLGQGPERTPRAHVSDVAPSLGVKTPEANISAGLSPNRRPTKLFMHRDENQRVIFMTDEHGNRFEPEYGDEPSLDHRTVTPSSDGEFTGVLAHHSMLFAMSTEPGEISTESVLSESTPAEGYAIELDMDPDTLSDAQKVQLNSIHGHQSTLMAKLITTTAMVAEQQAATEEIQDRILEVRREVISHVDSLCNGVNSQVSRLNRCLDDTVRIIRETGASSTQVQSILRIMGHNGGTHHVERDAPPPHEEPLVVHRPRLPKDIRASLDAAVFPQGVDEGPDESERRAHGVLRTKEYAHAAFPLPDTVERNSPALGVPTPKTARFENDLAPYDVSSISCARDVLWNASDTARFKSQRLPDAAPIPLHNSAVAYASGRADTACDGVADFADDTADQIYELIDAKGSIKQELPPSCHSAKVADPVRFRGQDDHNLFMIEFLERLLSYMQAGTFRGPALDWYRVNIVQNYVDGEAHHWVASEVSAYGKANNGALPLFADLMCAMHKRFVKLSSAQRAMRAFDAVCWKPEEGPEKLYSDLMDRSRRMTEMPSDFAICWCTTKVDPIRSHARQVWESETAMRAEEAAANEPLCYRSNDGNRAPRNPRYTPRTSDRVAPPPRQELPRNSNRVASSSCPARYPHDCSTDRLSKDMDGGKKVCFSCGGDHFAKDKICPNYGAPRVPKPRVAAGRVLESYSEEDTDFDPNQSGDESEYERDTQEAPDLEELITSSNSEHVRVNAMNTVHYYSMRIVPDEDDNSSVGPTESSLSSNSGTESDESQSPTLVPQFGYSDSPICVVCHNCSLVSRQVAATPENGLPFDREYTVCEHLANVGLTVKREDPHEAPQLTPVPLPGDVTMEEHPEEYFEGVLMNSSGDPDFEPGVLVDTTQPSPSGVLSAEAEVRLHEESRSRRGLRPLTLLEYHTNIMWLRRYRAYFDRETRYEDELAERNAEAHEELRNHPQLGARTRGYDMLAELPDARAEEARIAMRGPSTEHDREAEQVIVSRQLGRRARTHELHLWVLDRKRQAVVTRQFITHNNARLVTIHEELDNPFIRGRDEQLWEDAQAEARALLTRLSEAMTSMRWEYEAAVNLCAKSRSEDVITSLLDDTLDRNNRPSTVSYMNRARPSRAPATAPSFPPYEAGILVPGQENLGLVPMDEANYWGESTLFSNEELGSLQTAAGNPLPSWRCPDEHSPERYCAAHIITNDTKIDYASKGDDIPEAEHGPTVLESYDSAGDHLVTPRPKDELIL